ncbi:hypothetical protein LCGC14_0873740 [marine sediment metagenome]|uniref:Uncharacterized protein n=1 Tax=marine sediment metagenome TaxID=412755 RepID=A0A0F9PPP8_9ZZZZ
MTTTTEFRVVCSRFGTRDHSGHVSVKTGNDAEKRAVQAVIDANHHAETVVGSDHFYRQEAPYRIQTREVSEWEDSDVQ